MQLCKVLGSISNLGSLDCSIEVGVGVLTIVVAVVGAISVYIAMNNEEQDVKNILVLQKWRESTRKQMKAKSLCINMLCDFLCFPILAKLTLKKI